MRTLWLLLLSLMTCLAIGAAVAQDQLPVPFQSEYEVLRDGKRIGTATVSLQRRVDGDWDFDTTTTGTKGLAALLAIEIVEHSRFRWQEGRPELIDYHYRQDSIWSSRERHLSVDAERLTITRQERNSNGSMAFEPGVMDRHTVVLAIAAALERGTETHTYRVADRGRIEDQRYRRVAGFEKIMSGDVEVSAVRIERIRSNPGRSTTLWLNLEFPYSPVRIMQQEPDGETLEMRLLRRVR